NQQTFSGDARLKFKILDELSVSAFGSYVRDNWNGREFRSKLDWDQREDSNYQGMGYAYKRNELNWTKTFESTIDYNKTFNEKHIVRGLLGDSDPYSPLEWFDMRINCSTTDGFLD